MLKGQSGLAKDVGKSSFGEDTVLRHNRAKGLLSCFSFDRDMAPFLAQFDKTSALERSNETLSRDARQLRHLACDFYDCPKGLLLGNGIFRPAPSLKVEFDGFLEVRPRRLNVLPLGSNIELRAAGHVQSVLFRDESGEAVDHVSNANARARMKQGGGRRLTEFWGEVTWRMNPT